MPVAALRSLLPALVAVLAAGTALPPAGAAGQATVHVAPDDPAYRDLERIAAWGLVDTRLAGQRPWSRAEVARQLAEALANRARLAGEPALAATADGVLDRLADRFAPELARLGAVAAPPPPSFPLAGEARLDLGWSNSAFREVPSNTLGSVDARLNPLLAHDLGRDRVQGATAGLEVELRGPLWGAAAVSVRPRVQFAVPTEGDAETTVEVHSGQFRVLAGNAALTVGRGHLLWGQSPDGGLLLSSNPGALIMGSLATEHPVRLPWILGALGPSLHQVFYADLGKEAQVFPHAYLFGFRSSFLPHPRLEMGLEFLVESGGEGSPEATLGDRILDHLFFPDLFSDREFTFSQKMAGFDLRLRVPEARGLELYLEGVIDDIDVDRFRSMIWEDGGWIAGARVARVDDAGTVGVRLEGRHTGLRFYEHFDFASGLTLERRILGSELGPDANGVYLSADWEPGSRDAFFLTAAWERRSNDHHRLVEGNPFYFTRTALRPKEIRWRGVAAWEHRRRDAGAWRMRLEGGYERVAGFAFTRGDGRDHLMARAVVDVRFR